MQVGSGARAGRRSPSPAVRGELTQGHPEHVQAQDRCDVRGGADRSGGDERDAPVGSPAPRIPASIPSGIPTSTTIIRAKRASSAERPTRSKMSVVTGVPVCTEMDTPKLKWAAPSSQCQYCRTTGSFRWYLAFSACTSAGEGGHEPINTWRVEPGLKYSRPNTIMLSTTSSARPPASRLSRKRVMRMARF